MRTLIDRNDKVQIVKVQDRNSLLPAYQVEDLSKICGTADYVTARCLTLQEARVKSGLIRNIPASKTTLPKSAYKEQQRGYKKSSTKR